MEKYVMLDSMDRELAQLWWDGEEVKCSSANILHILESEHDLKKKAGQESLDRFVRKFRNGYLRFKRA